MLSVRTKVNSRLSEKLRKTKNAPYSDSQKSKNFLNMTSTNNGTPTKFPTLNVVSLGEPSTADDLEHIRQNAIISTIELKAYTTTTLTDARNIIDKAGDIMYQMGYNLLPGFPNDISSGDVKIMVARFRRTVGAGDIENM